MRFSLAEESFPKYYGGTVFWQGFFTEIVQKNSFGLSVLAPGKSSAPILGHS